MSSSSANCATARRLEGKVALITGGASGIGEATVRLYVSHGAKVLVADLQDDLGHALCKELGDEDTISYVHCNVTSDSDVKNAVDTAVAKYGKLDIMFNNAGIQGNWIPSILENDDDEFKKIVEVNLFGGYLGAKHAARVMIPAKKGCILFSSSLASVICMGPGSHGYHASKHAIVGLAKNLSVELGQHGIRVNCISPYMVATQMGNKFFVDKNTTEEIASRAANLKGVVLGVEDVAEAALYLGSDESRYISGINLVVDGGYSQNNPSFPMVVQSMFAASSS